MKRLLCIPINISTSLLKFGPIRMMLQKIFDEQTVVNDSFLYETY